MPTDRSWSCADTAGQSDQCDALTFEHAIAHLRVHKDDGAVRGFVEGNLMGLRECIVGINIEIGFMERNLGLATHGQCHGPNGSDGQQYRSGGREMHFELNLDPGASGGGFYVRCTRG